MTHIRVGIEPGQVWENRNRRRDGTRERLTVLEVNGRHALCESDGPSKGKAKIRRVGIYVVSGGSPQLGNLRLAATAAGTAVRFGPDGAVGPELARDLEGVAGLEALAAEGQ